MLANYPHLNLNLLEQFTLAQCEEALMYLRYYQSRLHAGPEKRELSDYITAIEERRQRCSEANGMVA
jgi:hypothetical protein